MPSSCVLAYGGAKGGGTVLDMLRAGRGTMQEQQPGALGVGQQRECLQQGALTIDAALKCGCHELLRGYRDAQAMKLRS